MTFNGYDRISEVLAPFSGLNYIDPDVLRNAGNRGTAIHELCDLIVLFFSPCQQEIEERVRNYCPINETDPEDKKFLRELKIVNGCLASFEEWYKNKNFQTKPNRFYDLDLHITGECDLLYKDQLGKLILVDLKTPMYESSTWLLQGSAYSYLAKKAGYAIDGIEFVQLSRIGKEAKVYKYQEDFNLFKSVLNTYRYFYKPELKWEMSEYL